MTHDELLAKINKEIQPCGTHTHFECKSKEENLPWITLRAIVELHWNARRKCVECHSAYPCQTIQKIMDELK
jgi:hypothetical protein